MGGAGSRATRRRNPCRTGLVPLMGTPIGDAAAVSERIGPAGRAPRARPRSRIPRPIVMSMAAEVPKVTPYLLDRGPQMCPRRLLYEYEGRAKTPDTFTRWRLREPFVNAARLMHRVMVPPIRERFVAPPELVKEEAVLYATAADTYMGIFGDQLACTVEDHGANTPTLSAARNVRVGGAIDVLVTLADGQAELRQFEFWGRLPCADPRESFAMTVAVLRLARWARGRTLRLRHADLIGGREDIVTVDYAADLATIRAHFDDRLQLIRSRMDASVTQVGLGCGNCGYVAGCPPHAHPAR